MRIGQGFDVHALVAGRRLVIGGVEQRRVTADQRLVFVVRALRGQLEAEATAGNRLAIVVGIGTNVVAAPEGTPTPAISLAALGSIRLRKPAYENSIWKTFQNTDGITMDAWVPHPYRGFIAGRVG